MQNSNFTLLSTVVGVLALAGCTTSPITAEFPALRFNAETETITRGTESVTIAPVLNEDDEIESVNVTVFGETVNFSRDDIINGLDDGQLVADFQNGSTIIVRGAFDGILEVSRAMNGEKANTRFREHFTGFIVEVDGDIFGQDRMAFSRADESHQMYDSEPSNALFESIPTQIVAVSAGNETDSDNIGDFLPEPQGDAPLTATYIGSAFLLDGGVGGINGNVRLDVNFNNRTVGGYIDRLRSDDPEVHLDARTDQLRGAAWQPSGQQIRINQTNINGNGFSTDLDLVEGAGLGDNNNLLTGTLQDAEAVEGFFSDSQVNGTFYGEQGEEIGGTIGYTRTGNFDLNGSNHVQGVANLDIGMDIEPEPVEGIGVFSTQAESGMKSYYGNEMNAVVADGDEGSSDE